MYRYETIIYWSEEDQSFMAHGDSQETALANAKEAIHLWLDTAKEFGNPIPEPKGRRLICA